MKFSEKRCNGDGVLLIILTVKNYHVTNYLTKPWTWTDSLILLKQRKRNMRFGTWNVRTLYRSVSAMTLAREFARYKLDLVGGTKETQ
jgi:hypothetical protein